jgi:hypothetical protein
MGCVMGTIPCLNTLSTVPKSTSYTHRNPPIIEYTTKHAISFQENTEEKEQIIIHIKSLQGNT